MIRLTTVEGDALHIKQAAILTLRQSYHRVGDPFIGEGEWVPTTTITTAGGEHEVLQSLGEILEQMK